MARPSLCPPPPPPPICARLRCWQDPGLFPGSHSPYPGPPPPRAPAVPVTMVGGVLGSQVVQRGPHALSQGASLCLLPWPTAPHVESSCFHAVPARLSQEELAGTELMGPLWRGCQIPPRARSHLGTHQNPHVCRAHGKVGQRPQLGPPDSLTELAQPRQGGAACPQGE